MAVNGAELCGGVGDAFFVVGNRGVAEERFTSPHSF